MNRLPSDTLSLSPPQGNMNTRGEKVFHVGTLSYTKRGLVVLFAWMLWGDFCFTLMETVVPSILPLKLKALGSSNTAMALIMSILPGILNATICPWVSFWSDRYRSRWGRRIPFILWTLPFLTIFLTALGYSVQIGTWLHRIAFSESGLFSSTTVVLIMIGFFMVGFQFFNMFVGSVYWYFFNDVVPEQCIGQFLGLFRMVGGLAGVFYNLLILKYAESHMTAILAGTALLYFLGFGLMCLKVREGEYPPPPEYVDGRQGVLAGLKTFFVECFSLRIYWYMFGVSMLWSLSGAVGMFNLIFMKEIGMSLERVGYLSAVCGGMGIALTYPAGYLADKHHPLRVQLVMQMIIITLFTPLTLVFLFVRMSPDTTYYYYFVISLAGLPAGVLWGASQLPTMMRIFPKERFGQFCAAQALLCSIGGIGGGLVVGLIFDGLKWYYQGSDFAYRWTPAWTWLFQILSFICLVRVYRGWKAYGGLQNYIPPLPKK